MPRSSTSFKRGQSGNRGGRPPKERALTTILAAAGHTTVPVAGKRIAGQRLIAQLLWTVATTGQATLASGTILEVSPGDWLALVKWLYSQIDGPPRLDPGAAEAPPAGGGRRLDLGQLTSAELLALEELLNKAAH
jgi:hypothetical protein